MSATATATELGFKVGDKFVITNQENVGCAHGYRDYYKNGNIVMFSWDDDSHCPKFVPDGYDVSEQDNWAYINFDDLKPINGVTKVDADDLTLIEFKGDYYIKYEFMAAIKNVRKFNMG